MYWDCKFRRHMQCPFKLEIYKDEERLLQTGASHNEISSTTKKGVSVQLDTEDVIRDLSKKRGRPRRLPSPRSSMSSPVSKRKRSSTAILRPRINRSRTVLEDTGTTTFEDRGLNRLRRAELAALSDLKDRVSIAPPLTTPRPPCRRGPWEAQKES